MIVGQFGTDMEAWKSNQCNKLNHQSVEDSTFFFRNASQSFQLPYTRHVQSEFLTVCGFSGCGWGDQKRKHGRSAGETSITQPSP